MEPAGELTDALDRKIAAAILRTAPQVEAAAAAKIVSMPPLDTLQSEPTIRRR